MPDYAGAVAAICQKMRDEWTTTPIVFQNASSEYDPSANTQQPWVYFEVIGTGSDLRACGSPGNNVWLYRGLIFAHVFVPINSGAGQAQSYAAAIGEIFRARAFYNDGAGAVVRTLAPRTDGGGSDADDGNWFRVTATVPFEYYHHG